MPAPKHDSKRLKWKPAYNPDASEADKRDAAERAIKLEKAIVWTPHQRYPHMHYPHAPAALTRELDIIRKWKKNQKQARDGPLFVRRVVDTNSRICKNKPQSNSANGFGSLAIYTAKYERKNRERPDLRDRKWMAPFLPKELRDLVDPSLRETVQVRQPAAGLHARRQNINKLFRDEDDEDDEKKSDNEQELPEQEQDEDWSDDEDDGAKKGEKNDYDAEQYFDDGDDDDVDPADDIGMHDENGFDGGMDDGDDREYGQGDEFNV